MPGHTDTKSHALYNCTHAYDMVRMKDWIDEQETHLLRRQNGLRCMDAPTARLSRHISI